VLAPAILVMHEAAVAQRPSRVRRACYSASRTKSAMPCQLPVTYVMSSCKKGLIV